MQKNDSLADGYIPPRLPGVLMARLCDGRAAASGAVSSPFTTRSDQLSDPPQIVLTRAACKGVAPARISR